MNFKYTNAISEHLPFGDGKRFIEMCTGIVSAPDYASAKEKAWKPIGERGEILQKELGIIPAYGNVQIELVKDETRDPSVEQIITMLKRKLIEAEQNSERATQWHAKVILDREAAKEAFAHVTKAATQAQLLQSLLDQIDGKSVEPLWDQ